MKYLRGFTFLLFLLFMQFSALTQNVLPDFNVKELTKGKVQISWNNPYESCVQLAVQRSGDSSKDFRTIFSTPSPELPSNGFLDNKPLYGIKAYYRIFYVLSGGAYYFSKPIAVLLTKPVNEMPLPKADPKKNMGKGKEVAGIPNPKDLIKIFIKKLKVFTLTKAEYSLFRDSINAKTKDALHKINDQSIEWRPAKAVPRKEKYISIYKKNKLLVTVNESTYKKIKDSIATQTLDTLFAIDQSRIQLHSFIPEEKKYIFIYKKDTLYSKLELQLYKRFKDSIATKTKDTLFFINNNQLEIHPFMTKYIWRPSVYIFTNLKGYVTILLPLAKQHRYRIIFYDEDGSEIFQIKSVREPELVLDKTNFVHAGWFSFDLFEDDKLKEKNKFFLQKE